MTRKDTAVVGALVLLLAMIAGIVGIPALQATTAPSSATPTPSQAIEARPYTEGIIGRPVSVSPLTARTQADRDLVSLVFSGLVRNGPDGTLVPDLAARWSVSDDGKEWTFDLQPDARWHDGEPVTAQDVVFTIQTLQDPAYTGPASTSWSEVTVSAASPTQVRFSLTTPLGGFLQAATQPIAPQHLLGGVPIADLPDDPFGGQPIGTGPFAVLELDTDHAELVPAAEVIAGVGNGNVGEDPSASPSAIPTDSLETGAPSLRPDRPTPYLTGMILRFFDDPAKLADAYRVGDLDAASGLPPDVAAELGATEGSHLLRYPASTLTAVLLNQRPSHPEFRDPVVRTALLQAVDRDAMVTRVWDSLALAATDPIPTSSWLFDPKADPAVAYDPEAAKKALKSAGWTSKSDGWHLPGASKPLTIEIVSPEVGANPAAFAAAATVTASWRAIGLTVNHVSLPPSKLVKDRLVPGTFAAAVTDVTIGLDPDLYPLLASSQTRTGGSNIAGVQDLALDKLLAKARAPGTDEARKAAYSALQERLGKGRYLLPLAFQDEVVVVRDTLTGPAVRQVADRSERFWDVLTWRLAVDR